YEDVVRVWDVATLEERQHLSGVAARLSPDGNTLATSLLDKKTLDIWNLATKRKTRSLTPPGGGELTAFVNDGAIAMWGADQILRCCEIQTGKIVTQLPGHTFRQDPSNRVYAVEISPDGKYVAFGGQSNEIAVYDLATQKLVTQINGPFSNISALAFSPDGQVLASGEWSPGPIYLWEVATGRSLAKFVGDQSRIGKLVFAANGSILVSGSEDSTALVWDLTGRPDPAKTPPRPL